MLSLKTTRRLQQLALFANSLRCNGASAAEGRPSVARLASSRQPVTRSGLFNPRNRLRTVLGYTRIEAKLEKTVTSLISPT